MIEKKLKENTSAGISVTMSYLIQKVIKSLVETIMSGCADDEIPEEISIT
jgi:hypothetical protein